MSSQRLIAAVMLPAWVVAVIGATSVVGNNAGAWVWPPDQVTLTEAIATGNYAEVVRQVELGADPNQAGDIRADMLTRRAIRVTPLQAATMGRNARMVRTLLDYGAIVLPRDYPVLACLNKANPNDEITESLAKFASGPAPDCSAVTYPK